MRHSSVVRARTCATDGVSSRFEAGRGRLLSRKGAIIVGVVAAPFIILLSLAVFIISTESPPASAGDDGEVSLAEAGEYYSDQGGPLETLYDNNFSSQGLYGEEPWFTTVTIKSQTYTICQNDILSSRLNDMGVPYSTIMKWQDLAKDKYDFGRVKPGQTLCLWYNQDNEVVRFEINVNSREQLVIARADEVYQARMVNVQPSMTEGEFLSDVPVPAWVDEKTGYHYYRGAIHSNFYNSAIKAGMTPASTMVMIKIFAHVNFTRDLREGDIFSLVTAPGENQGEEGPILGAMISVKGKPHYMFRFEEGKSFGYYDQKGTTTKKSKFICPIRYRRISSVFTYRRFHPVLHSYRPHLGVDFAASSGTPIYASTDGYVKSVGYRGGFGKSVSLSHGAYETMYNHLSGFVSGLKKGKFVKQGQVIGYCGSTGLSTGPHLDYRVFYNGKPVNPLNITSMAGEPVKDMKRFKRQREQFLAELERDLPMGPPRPWGAQKDADQDQPESNSKLTGDVYGDY